MYLRDCNLQFSGVGRIHLFFRLKMKALIFLIYLWPRLQTQTCMYDQVAALFKSYNLGNINLCFEWHYECRPVQRCLC
jgi:hypothetical protein